MILLKHDGNGLVMSFIKPTVARSIITSACKKEPTHYWLFESNDVCLCYNVYDESAHLRPLTSDDKKDTLLGVEIAIPNTLHSVLVKQYGVLFTEQSAQNSH